MNEQIEVTPHPLLPNGFGGVGSDADKQVEWHDHDDVNSPKLKSSINVSGPVNNVGFVTGSLTTFDATITSVNLRTLGNGDVFMVHAYLTARLSTNVYFAGFQRNAIVRSNGGVATVFDQVQDLFTMRQQDWDCDFATSGQILQLRVQGLAAQTITWTYAILLIPFI